jgi:hypothetical protein
MMKVAFIVTNPFQVIQFEHVARVFPEATFLVVMKNQSLVGPGRQRMEAIGCRIEALKPKMMPLIDGVYDLVFFQSPFPLMEKLVHSRLVSLQYGLAKERHNYGEWRALADMNLMYGAYSAGITEHFSPSFAVGNPKFDPWPALHQPAAVDQSKRTLGLDPAKPTVLYMPTWGDLGSAPELVPALARLQSRYNVIVKMHHNDDVSRPAVRAAALAAGVSLLFDGAADQLPLLSVADLVISDFSGAIFDAVYARVPVLLYQGGAETKTGLQKFDTQSLEYRRRGEIGRVCESVPALADAIAAALADRDALVRRAAPLRAELFTDDPTTPASARIRARAEQLLAGAVPPLTQPQLYVRETVRALRTARLALKWLPSPGRWRDLFGWLKRHGRTSRRG